jgi:hypothetical protein
MSDKFQHLQLIQSVVARMAQNSFNLKGWCVTLVAALFALGAKDANLRTAAIAFMPVVIFWFLDGYYLWKERQFRELYTKVAKDEEGNHVHFPYSMNVDEETHCHYSRSLFSWTIWPFYLVMFVIVSAVSLFGVLQSPDTVKPTTTTAPVVIIHHAIEAISGACLLLNRAGDIA